MYIKKTQRFLTKRDHYTRWMFLFDCLRITSPLLFLIGFYLEENAGWISFFPDILFLYGVWGIYSIESYDFSLRKMMKRKIYSSLLWLISFSAIFSLMSHGVGFFRNQLNGAVKILGGF